MNNIDKYIKLNFSLVKGEMIGIFCCTLFATLGIFSPEMAPMVLLYLVVMIVLFIRVMSKICDKTLFGEGAVLYQALPFSTEEVVVAKTFVITIATTLCWAGIMGGISIGMSAINTGKAEYVWLLTFVELLHEAGAISAVIVILKLIMDGFFFSSWIFAFTATMKVTQQYADRVFLSAMFIVVIIIQNSYMSEWLEALTRHNLLISNTLEIFVDLALGVCACMIVRYCLDKKYVLS